jgi:Putative DnaT-like ssDNA binding protein
MACAIVATAGAVNANSYATIAEGNTYHLNHLYGTDWDDADDDTKCRALIMATRLLDQTYDWYGSASSQTQALLWPRSAVGGRNGSLLANDTIPADIRDGTIEQARLLIISDRTADSETGVQGLKSLTAGPVSLEFTGVTSSKPISDSVDGFVGFYGSRRIGSGARVVLLRA